MTKKQKPFQSALPRGERRVTYAYNYDPNDFNPRSREGSDGTIIKAFACVNISIRAPARGATDWNKKNKEKVKFQSALPRGERHCNQDHRSRQTDFNPRSREGSDNF